MPAQKRHKTKYPGVYYIVGTDDRTGNPRPERIYYIMYRKDGKQIHEKAGRQFQDDMTPARAVGIRSERIAGKPSNKENREAVRAKKLAEKKKWTIDRLWEKYKSLKSDSKSLRVDTSRYDKYIKKKFGETEPKDLIQYHITRLHHNLLKKKSPQTVKHILALLKRIIHFSTDNGLCAGPAFKIKLPKVHNQKTEDLTPEQLQSLLKAIDADDSIQAGNMMKMALFTGMRRGEMFKLKWKDVNFDRGFIHIVDPKGGPDQKIPLNEAARNLLKSHVRAKSQYVFPGRKGKQRTDINHQVKRIKEAAGLPKNFRALHGLRHVYASMLASSGKVDMYHLQKLLTHKSPVMTQRYAHLRDEVLKKASNLAGELINEAVNGERKTIGMEIPRKGKG